MDNNAMVWIIVAIAAIVILALVAFIARRARNRRRHAEAERLRGEIGERSQHVERRANVAAETEAKARAAQAEAEAKAAEAARLQDRANTHRQAVDESREELDAQRERADALDPKRTVDEPAPGKGNETRQDVTGTPDPRHSREQQRS
jgi:flagellar biosynthesis/type III secretory pathway M-ring protein FliF/YscJ